MAISSGHATWNKTLNATRSLAMLLPCFLCFCVFNLKSWQPPLIMNHSCRSCLVDHTGDVRAKNMPKINWRRAWSSLLNLLPSAHLFHLSLGHAATVINDPCGLETCGLVELDEQLSHHVGQVLDDLLTEELLLMRRRSRRRALLTKFESLENWKRV